jgi:hypothetical protein
MPDLFDAAPDIPRAQLRKRRKANANPSKPPSYTLTFLPHEAKRFKRYRSKGGGYQEMVHWFFDNIHPLTLTATFDAVRLERLIRYVKKYDGGGPNQILRDSCIPALRRIGIELQPDFVNK